LQNILLACHALGLGAVWIGVYPRDDQELALRELLIRRFLDTQTADQWPGAGIPEPPGHQPQRAVALGQQG